MLHYKPMGRFILFIGIVQVILFLAHWFFYWTLVRFIGPLNPPRLLVLRLSIGLLSISLVATSLLAFRYSGFAVSLLYTTAASWLGILYFLILAAVLSWIVYGGARLLHVSLDRRTLVGILIGVAFAASLYGLMNAAAVRINRISVHLPNLPDAWKGKTAVLVTDIHLGQVRSEGFSRRIASMIKTFGPDMVLFGGDLFDGVAVDLDRAVRPFSEISTPYGAYFVTGNHEQFTDDTRYLQAVRRAGIRVLDNERIDLDGLQLIGVDYRDARGEENFRRILRKIDIDPLKPSILLKHVPLNLEVARERGISLQLSGHTHRGQLFLFRFITSRVYQGYDYGLKSFGNLLVCTSSGAGTWGPPMRVDTTPEIVLIKFR